MDELTHTQRLIFLDFDGVLNHDRHFASLRVGRTMADALVDAESFAPECIARLNAIVERTGADVVISSSWRVYPGFMLADLRGILKRHGFKGRMIGATPRLHRTSDGVERCRGDEIQAWIDKRGYDGPFVILDDVDNMAHLKPWLVQTSMATGLTDADVKRAVALLMWTP